jgi:hypothetical protein
MQIFDFSPTAGQTPAQGSLQRLSLVFKYGAEWTAEMEAQVTIMDLLGKYLDDRYYLLRNVSLPDLDVPIPFILLGPPGIQMIYVTPVRGIYRARGDLWFVVDTRRRFRPAAPNLIIRSTLMARAIQVFLEQRGFPNTKVDPILVSTSSGLYIEAIRPTIRIVMSDAVDRMIAGLQQDPLVLTRPEVEQMVQLLTSKAVVETPSAAVPAPPPEPYVPEQVSGETPNWMKDRLAGLDAQPLEEPAEIEETVEQAGSETESEPESAPAADEATAAEAHSEWRVEQLPTWPKPEPRVEPQIEPQDEPVSAPLNEPLGEPKSEPAPETRFEAAAESRPEIEPETAPEPTPISWGAPEPRFESSPEPTLAAALTPEADPVDVSVESEPRLTVEEFAPDEAQAETPRPSGFTRQQWTILGILIFLILLVVAVFFILQSTIP